MASPWMVRSAWASGRAGSTPTGAPVFQSPIWPPGSGAGAEPVGEVRWAQNDLIADPSAWPGVILEVVSAAPPYAPAVGDAVLPSMVDDPDIYRAFGSDAGPRAAGAATPGGGTSADVWVHTDVRGMGVAIDSALARAAAMAWTPGGAATFSKTAAVADLRALFLGAYLAANDLSSSPPSTVSIPGVGSVVLCGPRPIEAFVDFKNGEAAQNLQWALLELALRQATFNPPTPAQVPSPARWVTEGAGAPAAILTPDTSGWPLAAVGIAGVAGLTFLGAWALDVWEKRAAAEEDTRRMLALVAAATKVVEDHASADKAAGKQTPLSPAEQSIVDNLSKTVGAYAEATKARAAAEGKTLGGALSKAAESAGSALTIVGVLVAAYLFWKGAGRK